MVTTTLESAEPDDEVDKGNAMLERTVERDTWSRREGSNGFD